MVIPRGIGWVGTSLLAGVLAVTLTPPALADEGRPARVGAAQPAVIDVDSTPAYAGADAVLTATLRDGSGAGLAGEELRVERATDTGFTEVGRVVTGADGSIRGRYPQRRDPALNTFRVSLSASPTYEAAPVRHTVALLRRGSRVTLGAPKTVVFGRKARLSVGWVSRNGEGVTDVVTVQIKRQGRWRGLTKVQLRDGVGATGVSPTATTAYRLKAPRRAWVEGGTSSARRIKVVPPGDPVVLPPAAPRPRISLPDQKYAVGQGANAVVSRIPQGVWSSMTGISWRSGCPVGRSQLRYLQINYWDFDGFRRRGQLVLNAAVVGKTVGALSEMHRRKFPIRSMYLVDRFGYSARLNGADDYQSMAADNTSMFNCRSVVNKPGTRSPHATGRALDLNPWENPYRSRSGWTPNSWWRDQTHPRVAWKSRSHPVVKIFLRHGFRWTYGVGDSQHFDA